MLRFRPILMTTMAALFGALPLAFGTGTGSELRRPLGITIVGGLIVSQTAHAVYHAGGVSGARSAAASDAGKERDTFQSGTVRNLPRRISENDDDAKYSI